MLMVIQLSECLCFLVYNPGVWGVGLATRRCNLNCVPLGENTESWVLRHDGTMYHNREQSGKIPDVPQEGDVLVRVPPLFVIYAILH